MPDTSNNLRFRVGDEFDRRARVRWIGAERLSPYVCSVGSSTGYAFTESTLASGVPLVRPFAAGDKVRTGNGAGSGVLVAIHRSEAWVYFPDDKGCDTYGLSDLERVP